MNSLVPLLSAALATALFLPSVAPAQTVILRSTNQSRKLGSVLSGGSGNLISSNVESSFIGGGARNTIATNCSWSTIAGGNDNTASNSYVTVGGGFRNEASGQLSTVGGGQENIASGKYATVPGGVGGRATNWGSFVWSGRDTVDTCSTNNFSFTVRAPGGVRFITTEVDSTNVPTGNYNTAGFTNGVILAPNSGAWASLSDSNAKTKVAAIKPREILSKLAALPVTEWEYKVDPNRRYIGPMAQDFHAAFGLGSDDKSITTLDSDGVMYAAIQGLVEELKDRDKTIGELKAKLQSLESRIDSLPPAP